jgi:hypothetical protein
VDSGCLDGVVVTRGGVVGTGVGGVTAVVTTLGVVGAGLGEEGATGVDSGAFWGAVAAGSAFTGFPVNRSIPT